MIGAKSYMTNNSCSCSWFLLLLLRTKATIFENHPSQRTTLWISDTLWTMLSWPSF